MKIPKKFRTYCPFCKTHQEHVAERVRRASFIINPHCKAEEQTARHRNSGKFSKVPGGDKPTKRIWLRYRCSVCKKAHQRPCFRAKKFEFKE
jgi:large subunit ribosomal protein L44e